MTKKVAMIASHISVPVLRRPLGFDDLPFATRFAMASRRVPFFPVQSFSAARRRVLRDMGLFFTSSALGRSGLRVRRLRVGKRPQVQ